MMPLWMTTTLPVQSRCGWALFSFGLPCVAQRVWPMPNVPWSGAAFNFVSRFDSFPSARTTSTPLPFTTAIPA